MDIKNCRVCLKEQKLTYNIFTKTKSSMIYRKLMSLTKIKIYPNDGLPHLICRKCNGRLQNCIKFIKLCIKSDLKLKSTLKIKPEVELKPDSLSISPTNQSINKSAEDVKNEQETKAILTKPKNNMVNELATSNCKEKVTQKNQCFKCGKILSSSFRLKTHLATHSEEKPYSCQYCCKKFTLAQNLNVHLRIHTGEKPFHCTICGRSFTQSSGLIAHKRRHTGLTPYKCVLCPRSFRTVGHLQYHIRRHTGEKNYECDICSRAFITRSDLKQHLLTHSGEKLHVCSICGFRFSRSSNLKRHSLYCHSEGKSELCSHQIPQTYKDDFSKHEENKQYKAT